MFSDRYADITAELVKTNSDKQKTETKLEQTIIGFI